MRRRAVLIVLVAAGLLLAAGLVRLGAPWRAFSRLAAAMSAQYHDQVRMFIELNKLTPHAKLVVTELDNVVLGEYTSGKEWLGIDLGTTTLTYSVPVKFFFAVSLEGERPIEFEFSEEGSTLTVVFASVELFSMEPDLGKLDQSVEVGWARLAKYSGNDIKQRFRERIMADLRARGASLQMLQIVREPARKRLAELVRVFLNEAHPAEAPAVKHIRIRFRGEAAPAVQAADPG